jgi:hypothetical protein
VHGHWETPEGGPRVDVPFEDERLNLGIAVVIPAQKIVEILERPDFKALRTEVEQFGKGRLPPNTDRQIGDDSSARLVTR